MTFFTSQLKKQRSVLLGRTQRSKFIHLTNFQKKALIFHDLSCTINLYKIGGDKNMEKVSISTLRENLSTFLKKVQKGGVITITSRGHDMARLVPLEDKGVKSRKILRDLGKNAFIGDIISPIDEEWEAMK